VKRLIVALAAFVLAGAALGQLSKYKDWAKSPEAYFLTPSEKEEWSKVASDADAEKFIASYWARRDPTPATAQNEFRDAIQRRIAAADEQFKTRRQKGSETVRGRLFVVLGAPSRVATSRGGDQGGFMPENGLNVRPDSGSGPAGSAGPGAQAQTWIYDRSKFDPSWGIGELKISVNVDPVRGTDELTTAAVANSAIAKVAEKSVVNPSGQVAAAAPPAVAPAVPAAGTGAPSASAPPAAGAPPAAPAGGTAAAPRAATGGATAAAAAIPAEVRSALEPMARAAANRKEEANTALFGGAFHSTTGEPFYALQLCVPADKAAAPLKFGGVVTDAGGQEVATFWEDAALTDLKSGNRTDKVYDKSIVLPPGSYKAAVGLFPAAGGTPVASGSTAFQLEPKPAGFEVSPLIIGNTLTPLTKRPGPTDPFVFGTDKPIRVEPKANRLFAKEDGLWYFYTVTNPVTPAAAAPAPAATPAAGAAPAAPAPATEVKPRIMTRLTVLRDGQPAFAPFSGPAELQALGGTMFGTGSEIPLATFEPGWYTIAVNVRDLNAPRDSGAFKGVDRKEDFVVLKPDGNLPEKAAAKPAPRPRPPAKK
jgi:GWxTD domain-containing protein